MWDFFERKVCLTLEPDEWAQAEAEFRRVGLTGVQKFQALPIEGNILGPHQSFSASVRQILIDFHESGAKTLLHLEDDCVFKEHSHLIEGIRALPEQWDILYLGANIQSDARRVSDHLFQVTNAWTTHCIAFNRKVVPFILENQPGFNEMMIDTWLGSQLPRLQAFVVGPMIAYQRPRFSSIWGRFDDYTPIFEASDQKLAAA